MLPASNSCYTGTELDYATFEVQNGSFLARQNAFYHTTWASYKEIETAGRAGGR